jgi:hypothetical protein
MARQRSAPIRKRLRTGRRSGYAQGGRGGVPFEDNINPFAETIIPPLPIPAHPKIEFGTLLPMQKVDPPKMDKGKGGGKGGGGGKPQNMGMDKLAKGLISPLPRGPESKQPGQIHRRRQEEPDQSAGIRGPRGTGS